MMYFKTVVIDEFDAEIIEAAIRQSAAKRHTLLDFQSPETYIETEKLFLGTENESTIKITRIRTPFERLFPKLILKFGKGKGFNQYRIRYSILSNLVFFVLAISVILSIMPSFDSKETDNDMVFVIILFVVFLLFTLLELQLTKARLGIAIKRIKNTSSTHV